MTITRDGKSWIDQPGSLLGVLNIGLGVVLLIGSPLRTSTPSLAAARDLMPMKAWGGAFLLGGIICLGAHHAGRRGALAVAVGAGIHAVWAATLIHSATWDQRAALTGIVVYGWLAFLHAVTGIRLARRAR